MIIKQSAGQEEATSVLTKKLKQANLLKKMGMGEKEDSGSPNTPLTANRSGTEGTSIGKLVGTLKEDTSGKGEKKSNLSTSLSKFQTHVSQ